MAANRVCAQWANTEWDGMRRAWPKGTPMVRQKAEKHRQREAVHPSSANRSVSPYWSDDVTRASHALDLEAGLFTWENPAEIARSLLRSAEMSRRRKGTPFQSAMSMLNFYINRAGKNLPEERKHILEEAKEHLRRLHHCN